MCHSGPETWEIREPLYSLSFSVLNHTRSKDFFQYNLRVSLLSYFDLTFYRFRTLRTPNIITGFIFKYWYEPSLFTAIFLNVQCLSILFTTWFLKKYTLKLFNLFEQLKKTIFRFYMSRYSTHSLYCDLNNNILSSLCWSWTRKIWKGYFKNALTSSISEKLFQDPLARFHTKFGAKLY